MATLTKAKFLEATKKRVELIKDVPGFGDVYFRDVGEVQRSRRVAALFDVNGKRVPRAAERRRLYELIDQVCIDANGTPMFTDDDITDLEEVASNRLDPLYLALGVFNGDSEKKDTNGSAVTSGT